MRNLLKYISIVYVAMMSACSNVLVEDPKSLVTADARFSTATGIIDGVNGIYPSLRAFYGREEGLSLTVFGTDIYTYGLGGEFHAAFNEYSSALTGTSEFLSPVWNEFYRGINAANTVIGRVQDVSDLTDTEKNVIEAEARFLRASFYFHLVRQFGDVHFSLEETFGVEVEAFRTNQETIYNEGIIPDLEFAIQHLPDEQSDFGRPAKAAARGMLARAYSMQNTKWDIVEDLTEAVIEDLVYGGPLTENFAGLWDIDNQMNKEVIWSVQYSDDPALNGTGNGAHLYFLTQYDRNPAMDRDTENGRPWVRFMPTNYTLELFERDMDSRYDGTFTSVWFANKEGVINGQAVAPGDTAIYMVTWPVDDEVQAAKPYWYIDYNGNFTGADELAGAEVLANIDKTPAGEIGAEGRYYPSSKKFIDPTRVDKNTAEGQRDWPEMRLAEMYLLAAEAEFKQGKNDEAAAHINVVRRRAAWPGKEDDMEITSEEVDINFILDERARELLGEGHRWYDLKRTRTFESRLPMYNLNAWGFDPNIHYVRPIPQSIIDAITNPEDFLQSPGY